MIFANFGVLPRPGNHDLVLRKRPLCQIVERISAVGLHFRVILILMQDKEMNLISANYAIYDLPGRFARPSLDKARNRVPFLTKYEDIIATRRPASSQIG